MNLVKRKERSYSFIDEIHTPDSSHIFIQKDIRKGRIRKNKSNCLKNLYAVVRMVFKGLEGQQIPDMTESILKQCRNDILSCMKKSWEKFVKADISNINERIEKMC
jgi:phosphoribosylaminoimidazole-succinocarboxamide synthase